VGRERKAVYAAYDFSGEDLKVMQVEAALAGVSVPGTFLKGGAEFAAEADPDGHCIVHGNFAMQDYGCIGKRASAHVIIYPPKVCVEMVRRFVYKTTRRLKRDYELNRDPVHLHDHSAEHHLNKLGDSDVAIYIDLDTPEELARTLLLKIAARMVEHCGRYALKPLRKAEKKAA
jgi:hypothetical protein